MKTVLKCVVSGAAALTLACGGGGQSGPDISYSGSKTVVTIDESNVGTMTSMASATASGFAGGSYGSVSLKTGAATQANLRATYAKAFELLHAARIRKAVSVAGVTGSVKLDCQVSGSITLSASDRDGNGETVDAGDWVQAAFNACNDDGFTVGTGSVKLLVVATDGVQPSMTDPSGMTSGFEYGVKVTLNDFAFTSLQDRTYAGVNGDITSTVVWDAGTATLTNEIHGSSLASVVGGPTGVLEASLLAGAGGTGQYTMHTADTFTDASAMTLNATAWGMSARVCSLEMAGCIDLVADPELFQFVGDVYPDSGTLRVTGAGGAYIQVTANDGLTGAMTLSYDLDGAGVLAPVTIDTFWQCLGQPGAVCP